MIASYPHAVSGSRRHQNSPSFENIDLAVNAPRDLVTGKQTDAMLNRMCVLNCPEVKALLLAKLHL